MGFFKKIFGTTDSDSSNQDKIRAQYKDVQYFKKEIERFDLFIADDKEDFQIYIEKNGRLENHHYISACNIRLKKIECIYSLGGSINELLPILEEVLDNFFKINTESYKDNSLCLKCLSLCILLNTNATYKDQFETFLEKWEANDVEDSFKPVAIIYSLLSMSVTDKIVERGYYPYKLLFDITQLPKNDVEENIKEYLDKWYDLHKEDPWYNTHLRDKGYSGYWAWEVGAVVKRMGLDDSSFKDNPYYPYDMVHWQD
ncbi:MAG: DUF1911 domain-containing protein [Niabella sp.]